MQKPSERLKALCDRVDDMEDWSRHNNLCFVGFLEGCEAGDTIAFLGNRTEHLLLHLDMDNVQRPEIMGVRV